MAGRTMIGGCFLGLVFTALVVAPVAGYRWQVERAGQEYRDAVIAGIEKSDPDWRWEAIEAARPPVADSENAAVVVDELNRAIGSSNRFIPTRAFDRAVIDPQVRPNQLLDDEAYRLIARGMGPLVDECPPLVARLSRCPHGRWTLMAGRSAIDSKVADRQADLDFVTYFEWESERLLGRNESGAYATLLHAMLNVSRIERDVPTRSFRQWRLRFVDQSVRQLERGLALGLRSDDLAALQDDFRREAGAAHFHSAVRQIRAEYDLLFRAFESGERSLREHLKDRVGRPGLRDSGRAWLYRPDMPADWATTLELATAAEAVADQPESLRLAAWTALPKPPTDMRHAVSWECRNSIDSSLRQTLVTCALSRCAVVAVAAERFRLGTGNWPASLSVIPTSILPALPTDPFTGGPLSYVRRPDGVTISAAGPRTEFRLYDLGQRRLAPQPPTDGIDQ